MVSESTMSFIQSELSLTGVLKQNLERILDRLPAGVDAKNILDWHTIAPKKDFPEPKDRYYRVLDLLIDKGYSDAVKTVEDIETEKEQYKEMEQHQGMPERPGEEELEELAWDVLDELDNQGVNTDLIDLDDILLYMDPDDDFEENVNRVWRMLSHKEEEIETPSREPESVHRFPPQEEPIEDVTEPRYEEVKYPFTREKEVEKEEELSEARKEARERMKKEADKAKEQLFPEKEFEDLEAEEKQRLKDLVEPPENHVKESEIKEEKEETTGLFSKLRTEGPTKYSKQETLKEEEEEEKGLKEQEDELAPSPDELEEKEEGLKEKDETGGEYSSHGVITRD